jgi:DNA polymerase III epsilon subunit-like protein
MDEDFLRFDKEKEYVFIDCETFNLCLNSCHNLPWQIAMLKVVGDRKIAEKNFYIKWDTKLEISPEAARITRFNPKALEKKGLTPEEVFPTIEDWLDNCDYIAGHNTLGFDVYLIKDYYRYMGKPYRHIMPKMIDTNCIAKGVKCGVHYRNTDDLLEYQYKMYHERRKGIKTNLTAMGKEYEIKHDYDKLHDAIVDLELNLKVWNKLKWQIEL